MLTYDPQKENSQLAKWVSTQRQEYKLMRDGKKHRMSTEKMKALTSLGFLWAIPRGCSAKLKYIKMNEQHYKAEMARHEGTEFDLNDVVNTIVFEDPVVDLPQSFGREINLTPESTPTPPLHQIPNVSQTTRRATLESKVLDPKSVAVTLINECVLKHLSCKQLEFSQSPRSSDYLEGSLTAYPSLFGVTHINQLVKVNNCHVSDMCARLQRSGNHTSFTLSGYGESNIYGIYPGVSEHLLQHATAIDTNPMLIGTNIKMSQKNRNKLLQANLVKSLQLEELAQLRFDHAYIAKYAAADQLSSASKVLP